MNLLSENIIPGNHGKIFGANAKDKQGLEKIKSKVLSIDGIKNVIINTEIYPKEFTIYTNKLVTVNDIENAVISLGFQPVPEDIFDI